MKLLLRQGKIVEKNTYGLGRIYFTNFDTDFSLEFGKSAYEVISLLRRYVLRKYQTELEQPVFYFHHQKMDRELIETELDRILINKDHSNIINYEDISLREAISGEDINKKMRVITNQEVYVEESIYWDVINHFIIVVGMNNLRKFLYALEEEKVKRDLALFNVTNPFSHLNNPEVKKDLREMVYSYTISE